MIGFILCFALGIFSLLYFSPMLVLLFGCLFIFIDVYFNKKLAFSFFLGAIYLICYVQYVVSPPLERSIWNKWVAVEGKVISKPYQKGKGLKFIFLIKKINQKPAKQTVLLASYQPNIVIKGDEDWRFIAKLKPVHSLNNPGSFDYKRYLFSKGIRTKGYIKKGIRLKKNNEFSILALRLNLAFKIKKALGDSGYYPILESLALGFKNEISAAQWDIFRATGTSHLMAISGLHVGLITGCFYFIFNLFWRSISCSCLYFPAQRAASIFALLITIIYSTITGFSIPTQRALVMVSVFLLARILNYKTSVWRSLLLAALIVILISPLSLLSPGFYLSFSAVAILLLCITRVNLIAFFKAQAYLMLGLLPFTLLFFSYGSLISIPANIIAIPLMAWLIVPLLFIAIGLSFFSPYLFTKIILICSTLIKFLFDYLSYLMRLEWINIRDIYLNNVQAFFFFLALIFFIFPMREKLKPFCFFFILPVIFPLYSRPNIAHAKISVLDVGQGSAVFIQTKYHTLLYDSGPKWYQSSDAGERIIIPFLQTQGIKTIDRVVISHEDSDHNGGLLSIQKKIHIKQLIRNKSIKNSLDCKKIKSWLWDGVRFQFIGQNLKAYKENNRSCILKVTAQGKSLLLPGDIEKKQEQKLLKEAGGYLRAKYLLAPHHGSKSSSTLAFIKAVSAQYVIFSAGFLNRYHFPNEQVIKHYQPSVSYNTANCGLVSWTLQADLVEPDCYYQPPWYA